MALIDHIDAPNRNIHLSASTVNSSIHPIDIYKEMRTLRKNNEELRKQDLFMSGHGFEPKGGGKYTERYVKLINGTRIIPYDTSHELTVTGTMITDEGTEGTACFDRTPLSASTVVDINYIPTQVEVIVISTGGSSLTTEEHNTLMGSAQEINATDNKNDLIGVIEDNSL